MNEKWKDMEEMELDMKFIDISREKFEPEPGSEPRISRSEVRFPFQVRIFLLKSKLLILQGTKIIGWI